MTPSPSRSPFCPRNSRSRPSSPSAETSRSCRPLATSAGSSAPSNSTPARSSAWASTSTATSSPMPATSSARTAWARPPWPALEPFEPVPYTKVYRAAIEKHPGQLTVVCIGPLTNLAELWRTNLGLLKQAKRIVIMGGAVWCKGNVARRGGVQLLPRPRRRRDRPRRRPAVTLVPLDLTNFLHMDESHLAAPGRLRPPRGQVPVQRPGLAHAKRYRRLAAGPLHRPRCRRHRLPPLAGAASCRPSSPIKVCTEAPLCGKCQPVPRRDSVPQADLRPDHRRRRGLPREHARSPLQPAVRRVAI